MPMIEIFTPLSGPPNEMQKTNAKSADDLMKSYFQDKGDPGETKPKWKRTGHVLGGVPRSDNLEHCGKIA
jgi:hypothetical protein